jgi:hypothetical protein
MWNTAVLLIHLIHTTRGDSVFKFTKPENSNKKWNLEQAILSQDIVFNESAANLPVLCNLLTHDRINGGNISDAVKAWGKRVIMLCLVSYQYPTLHTVVSLVTSCARGAHLDQGLTLICKTVKRNKVALVMVAIQLRKKKICLCLPAFFRMYCFYEFQCIARLVLRNNISKSSAHFPKQGPKIC